MRKRNIVLPARSIAYIMNQDKTEGGLLIGGNAGTTPEEVFAASMAFFLSKISNLLYNLIK